MRNITIVGGNFGDNRKPSSIIKKFADALKPTFLVNGGFLEQLPTNLFDSDLTLWMPNIDNENEKQYPKKKIGSVLICSKVMREGYTEADAVARIFKMGGNAVIAIRKVKEMTLDLFEFQLIDALGNTWYRGTHTSELINAIERFYSFTKDSVRVRTSQTSIDFKGDRTLLESDINCLVRTNNAIADKIQTSCGVRFFGNLSTRCQRLFPSVRADSKIIVSPRNVDKSGLTASQMVTAFMVDDEVYYSGDRKPSVDTPTQLKIYQECPEVNFMIHGHAFVKGAITTKHYYLCGDVREADEVIEIIKRSTYSTGVINLKNHGFLFYSKSLGMLDTLAKNSEFYYDREESVNE